MVITAHLLQSCCLCARLVHFPEAARWEECETSKQSYAKYESKASPMHKGLLKGTLWFLSTR